MIKNLPLYEMIIDEEGQGMYTISLVSRPAVKSHFLAFSAEVEEAAKISFSIENEEEHKILAVIARCDFPIYRVDEQTGKEFYVTFNKETIEFMSQKFLKDGFQNLINIEHQENSYVNGVELQEIFIKNTDKGIDPKGFEEIENGSLFGLYKIENEEIWNEIKDGTFTGVSLEGLFKLKRKEDEPKERIIDSLEDLFNLLRN